MWDYQRDVGQVAKFVSWRKIENFRNGEPCKGLYPYCNEKSQEEYEIPSDGNDRTSIKQEEQQEVISSKEDEQSKIMTLEVETQRPKAKNKINGCCCKCLMKRSVHTKNKFEIL